MKTLLVTTSYHYDGKIESFTRPYLPTEGEGAVAQARAWVQQVGITYDAGTEVHYTVEPVTPETLRSSAEDLSELVALVGRVCALEAVDQGAPPIPEGQTYQEWRAGIELPWPADFDFLREVAGAEMATLVRALFVDAYLKNLFDASPSGPNEEGIRKKINGNFTLKEVRQWGWPIAWQGTVSAEDRAAQECDLAGLIAEAEEALRVDGAVSVEVRDGEVIAVEVEVEEEEEEEEEEE
jgi:hypothetical protein